MKGYFTSVYLLPAGVSVSGTITCTVVVNTSGLIYIYGVLGSPWSPRAIAVHRLADPPSRVTPPITFAPAHTQLLPIFRPFCLFPPPGGRY